MRPTIHTQKQHQTTTAKSHMAQETKDNANLTSTTRPSKETKKASQTSNQQPQARKQMRIKHIQHGSV
jgi:hypothetical protein